MVAEMADPAIGAVHPFTRMAQLVADRDALYSDAQNRERGDEPPPAWLIDGLLPVGVTLIVADPGAGKSFVVQQMLHHLCYGRPLGDWDPPALGGHLSWVIDLEGDSALTRERGYAITPYGDLPEDGTRGRRDNYLWYSAFVVPPPEREAWHTIRLQAHRHIAYIDQALTDAREAGMPLSVVVVDTLAKFMGPRPPRENAYQWEAETVGELNRVALRHGVAVVLVHHTNKAGEVSGSTGLAGSATVAAKLDVTRDDKSGHTSAVLRSLKVRNGPAFAYPMIQQDDGTWTFTETIGPAEAGAVGYKRAILAELRKGPRSRAELRPLGIGASLGKVLDRLRRDGTIRLYFGRWTLVPDPRRTRPGPGFSRCESCHEPMLVAIEGQRTHPTCPALPLDQADDEPADESPATSPIPVSDEYDEPADETLAFNGFRLMKDALAASRMHPVPRIRESDRESSPWSLITERMTGEHRWERAELPMTGLVAVLDRSGSYPSAAGGTKVAANLLTHTGPLDEPRDAQGKPLAGIFRIDHVPWVDPRIGHPLGRLARLDAGAELWVTTPHLDLLYTLAAAGAIPRPVIRDSWTGRGTGGLFTAFSKAVREAREQHKNDPEAYVAVKRRSSIALRSLWPKESRSPFWRPDWSVSIRAEASVRHWVRAWQAVGHGAELLSIGSVDEVAFLAPDDADQSWAPAPYVIGSRFGQVKHKDVKIGDELLPSPLPADTWANRHKGKRGRRA